MNTLTTTTVTLWQVGGTPKAYLFARRPHSSAPVQKDCVWLPREAIHSIQRETADGELWHKCRVTIPEDLAMMKGLI